MKVLPVQEFAAKRRGEQDALIEVLLPEVTKGIGRTGEDRWEPLLAAITEEYRAAFAREGGEKITRLASLLTMVKAMLGHIDEPEPTTAQSTATAIAVAILNYSIMDAADDDPEPLVLEWVTMHDNAVRASHKDADGQQRPAGEKFTVGGAKMLAPGDVSAPIEEWINCRCVLAPAFAAVTAAISEKPWDGSASRFSDQEWKSSCIIHVCDGMEKSCHKLPIKEPGGALSRAGVHAAAGRIGQVDAPAEKIASAKRVLRGAYRQLGEDPPESLTADASGGTVSPTQEEPMTETETEPEVSAADFGPMQWHGVLAPEEEWSGDGRMFMKDSLSFRDLPLPLTWQKESDDGHKGSVVVGSIETVERRDNLMFATGTFLPTVEADELIGMVSHFGKFGVSVDADDVEFEFDDQESMNPKLKFSKARVSSASVVPIPAFTQAYIALGMESDEALAASLDWPDLSKVWTIHPETSGGSVYTWGGYPLTFTSTNTATFRRGPGWITDPVATRRIHAYWTQKGQPGYEKIGWGVPGDFNRCRVLVGEKIAENSPEDLRFLNNICAQWHHDALGFWPGRAPSEQALDTPHGRPAPAVSLTASGEPIIAPSEWFADPQFDRPTALTVTEEGRVFGHIAQWGTCHVGFDGVCVEPPPSSFDYAYFQTGAVLTDQGNIAVGHLTAGGGHAPHHLRAREAAAHYDKTSSCVADVCAGDDDHGIWVAGWVRPGTTPEQVYTLRASAISGDWRNVGGVLELIAAHCVNSPGFPVVRVAAGVQETLVASTGPRQTAEEPMDKIVDSLAEKVAAALEARQARRDKMRELAAQVRGEEG